MKPPTRGGLTVEQMRASQRARRLPKVSLLPLLVEMEAAGLVERDGRYWRASEKLEREFGWALRTMP